MLKKLFLLYLLSSAGSVTLYASSQKSAAQVNNAEAEEEEDTSLEITFFYCDQCSYHSKKPSDVERHKKAHSSEKHFFCRYCNEGYKHKRDAEIHEESRCSKRRLTETTDAPTDTPYEAEEDDDEETQIALSATQEKAAAPALTDNILRRPGALLKCHKCDYTTYKPDRLRSHSVRHISIGSIICDGCGERFKHSHYLTHHKKYYCSVLATEEVPKNIVCPYCGHRVAKAWNLNKHMRNKHPEKVATAPGVAQPTEQNTGGGGSSSHAPAAPPPPIATPAEPELDAFLSDESFFNALSPLFTEIELAKMCAETPVMVDLKLAPALTADELAEMLAFAQTYNPLAGPASPLPESKE